MRRPLGQHFLFDPSILERIVHCSGLSRDETVLEVGAGLGTLTRHLAGASAHVIAIEKDRRLIERLKQRLTDLDNIEIICGDALQFQLENIGKPFRVVANIPYSITSPLIFRFLEHRDMILSMTLLMQTEVAERIVAVPGSRTYGVLSVMTQVYSVPELKFRVSRGAFSPPPDVDSAVVHFSIPDKPPYDIRDENVFRTIVKTAFSQRRKTLANSLRSIKGIQDAIQKCGIDPSLRPERLSIADFAALAGRMGEE
jgi:16S rRNA (adenine1518-N6/adenine1519-N6)-dimethyltransferase